MLKLDFLFTRDRCRGEEGNIRDVNLAKIFLKKGYSCGMISSCQIIHSQLKKEGIFSVQMLETIKVPSKLENIDERADRIEKEYNIPSLKRFIFPERCYYNEDEEYLFRKAIVYFEELEKLFNQIQVKCLVHGQGGQINIRTLYFIAKKRGIPVIYFGESLFPNKILLYSDEMNTLDRFRNIRWEEMANRQKEEIEEHMRQFRKEQGVFTYSIIFTEKDKIIRSFIGLQEYIKNKQFRGLKDAFVRRFKKGIFDILNKVFSNFLYQRNLKDEKFIYFPLHEPDDSQITLRNPQFYEQDVLALYIARSLPFGYKLYVKEHPGSLLAFRDKINFLKEKNIVLLRPGINSHQIIKKSKAVIIINSTVGFEALHYFKPVVVLGNWGLRGKGITIDVDDLSKLDEAIKFAFQRKIDQNKIKAFLFSLKESMFEGCLVVKRMDYAKIAAMVIKRYEELSYEKRKVKK